MRVWLDPGKVAERGLTAPEIVKAIREQNVQVAAGVIGAPPNDRRTPLQLNVNAQGRLKDEAEFAQIILKTAPDGGVTRLGDVARIELAAAEYGLRALLDNKPAVAIPIFQTPGSNALDISTQVRETMAELEKDFPPSVKYSIVYDPTQFVRASIKAVITTLLEAIALVVLVVIVFLQTWRASIIPLLAVPVSIIGTFSLMLGFGYSINALSLFGMVLAIGIVVDDAIVVVENVERNIEAGLSPREATYRAMREVSGPIIAIALVLVAVFVPLAFMTGLTGQFYKQFALTIAISTVISAFNSLTLSPALAALLLKGHDTPPDWLTRADGALVRRLLRALQPLLQSQQRALRPRRHRRHQPQGLGHGRVCRASRAHRGHFLCGARRLRAGPGQAVPGQLCPAPRAAPPSTAPRR
jgi:multidrug efflux pump